MGMRNERVSVLADVSSRAMEWLAPLPRTRAEIVQAVESASRVLVLVGQTSCRMCEELLEAFYDLGEPIAAERLFFSFVEDGSTWAFDVVELFGVSAFPSLALVVDGAIIEMWEGGLSEKERDGRARELRQTLLAVTAR